MKERHGPIGASAKVIRGLGCLSYEERLRVWIAQSGEEKALCCCFSVLKEASIKYENRNLLRFCCDRTRGNGLKLKETIFRLDIRNFCFPMGW